MEELFRTVPEEPEGFHQHCFSLLPQIPIYYRRNKKTADCRCGKCGKVYLIDQKPVRNKPAKCPCCGNEGYWEWMKVTTGVYESHSISLIQCTMIGNVVIRGYRVELQFRQGRMARIELNEVKRIFLQLGSTLYFNNENHYTGKGWSRTWTAGKGNEAVYLSNVYAGWRSEIKKSRLKYCDVDAIKSGGAGGYGTADILIAFANNPALEMYCKAGMSRLVNFLVRKEGKTRLVNRRSTTLLGQLRVRDKTAVNRLITHKGDTGLLEVMQLEKRTGQRFTEEQEIFVTDQYSKHYGGKTRLNYLLQYMSVQKLMNRLEKYVAQGDYSSTNTAIGAYYDYLQMRQELGYDMSNELYIHPGNLKEKHDQMVKERNARKDELHIQKMMQKFPDIAKRYQTLDKKYKFEAGGYVIRPARDAAEIVVEGRTLHHCVGSENYLGKHNRGETFILFLRKKDALDTPYYTVEIRNTEIVQWYGAYDKKPDSEIIGPWLDAYTSQLKTRQKRKTAVA